MADINSMLADAKSASAHADETEALHKTSPTPVPDQLKAPAKPSYTAARAERKSPTMSDEIKAKNDMVDKAKKALD